MTLSNSNVIRRNCAGFPQNATQDSISFIMDVKLITHGTSQQV